MTISLRMQATRATLKDLTLGAQLLVVRLDDRVAAGGGEEVGHIEQVADFAASALDVARPATGAAVIVIRPQPPHQRGGRPVADVAELGQPGDPRRRQTAAPQPRHALDHRAAGGEWRIWRMPLDPDGDRRFELRALGHDHLGDRALGAFFPDQGRLAVLARPAA